MAALSKSNVKKQKVNFPERGDIYLVNFNPAVGSEIQKVRPALIIQNDIGNQYSQLTIVAAITSKFGLPPYPTEVAIDTKETGLPRLSAVLLNQVRSVDRQRLVKRIGQASPSVMHRVNRAIQISFGLVGVHSADKAFSPLG